MSGPIKGVVFDLDGTLAETHPMAIAHIGESISRHGGPSLSREDVLALFGPNEKGIFRHLLGSAWEEAWGWYIDSYVDKHAICPSPFEGIPEILDELAAMRCCLAVVTGKTAESGSLSLEVLGLRDYFPRVLGGSMDGVTKGAQLLELVDEWGLGVAEVLYVGDTVSDVAEARSVGVRPVSAAWSVFADSRALASAGPEALFEDVAGFAGWLFGREPSVGC